MVASDAMQEFRTLPSSAGHYFDHNATTPLAVEVSEQVPEWLSNWGNASSIHQFGRGPKAQIRESRRALAQALGCGDLELVFTSGGSESNTSIIRSVFEAELVKPKDQRRLQMICSSVEHPAVYEAMDSLKPQGLQVVKIPVDRSGFLDLETLKHALADRPTCLVSIMYANNETGSVLPVVQACRLAHEYGSLFHSDMVQALGKIPFRLDELGFDFASFSAHKFYSLKGCGLAYVRTGRQLSSLIKGGRQERSRRAGTENTLAIAAFGLMAGRISEVEARSLQVKALRDGFEDSLKSKISGVRINGADAERLPNCTSAVIPDVDGETLLMNLDMKGFAVSTGAACSSGSPEPSPTLLAMGLSREEAQSSLRVGMGWSTTKEQVDALVEALVSTVERLRSFKIQMDVR